MDIPEFRQYYAPRFSGSSDKYANFHGPKRLYAHGFKYELVLFPIVAVFDFVWEYNISGMDKRVIIRNTALDCPLQLIAVDGNIDYESFTSLN